ncbi:hypothetical protein BD414DRAFT_530610 [Trametes punicea]|nr:hypothetical protein BD414DRAFT_530610 [Trametes punicea]
MEAQRFDPAVKEPKALKITASSISAWEDEEEWLIRCPSPPPSTPRVPRYRTPLEEQRFDPFKTMLAATSPPRYPSPDPEHLSDYPELTNSAMLRYPTASDAYDDLLAYHLGNNGPGDEFEDQCPSSGASSPTDETGVLYNVSTYHLNGAGDDGDYSIERTILRPAPQRRFDLTKSLSTLAVRSSTTLRTKPSFSFSSGTTTPGSSEDESSNIIAPPTSRQVSRRPSLAIAPLPVGEITESLKRLAARLVPLCGAEDHFEESVGHFEDAWAREERGEPVVEVLVTRLQASVVEPEDSCDVVDHEHDRDGNSLGFGLYASGPAARR